MAEFDRAVLPVNFVIVGIEGVVRHHLEGRQVAPAAADRLQVVEPDAGLRNRERISGRPRQSRSHVRLEDSDGCNRQVDIVAPARHHRRTLDPRVVPRFEEGEKRFAHQIGRAHV